MADEMVLDAAPEIAEPSIESTEPVETGETTEETPTESSETQEQPQGEYRGAIQGNNLSPSAKAALDRIKAEDPVNGSRLAGEIRTALFQTQELKTAFPGGIKEARETAQFVSEIGGREGFTKAKEDLDFFNEFNNRFIAGDSSVMKDMAKSEPASFVKVMPEALNNYWNLHPAAMQQHVSAVMADFMNANQIPLQMLRLGDYLQGSEQGKALWQSINGFMDKIVQTARTKVQDPKFETQAAADPTLDQREQQLTQREWTSSTNATKQNVVNAEKSRILNGRKPNAAQAEEIDQLFELRLANIGKQSPGHEKEIDKFFAQRNKGAYDKHMQSFFRANVGKAMDRAITAVMGNKPGPKPVPKPNGLAPKPAVKSVNRPGDDEWELVSEKPTDLDLIRTTREMYMQNRGITLAGKQKRWIRR